jgi:hypothetical protein
MEIKVSNRILDIAALDKLSTVISIAKEYSLAVSLDFLGNLWIMQMFDQQERLVISANADTATEVVNKVHEDWLKRTSPKL